MTHLPVIVGAARTPVGRLLGSLASKSASDLGGVAIGAAITRAGITPDQVQYVIMGQVLQAGAGQITARQAAVKAGIPMTTPAVTVNKVCLSGLDAIVLAANMIRLGEYDVIVAGGMESMTNAPHLLPGSRRGFKYGPAIASGRPVCMTFSSTGSRSRTAEIFEPTSRMHGSSRTASIRSGSVTKYGLM